MATEGVNVVITYSKGADAAAAVVEEIERGGGKAKAVQADAADAEAIKAAIETAVATYGGLDILVNNAGTAIPAPFEEASAGDINRVIDINLRGLMFATQAALKHLRDGGRIITIGSCVGERMMTPGLVAYAATKGAVKMFVQGLSREVGHRGITVNNIQPGPIDTDLNPASGDWATPQIANTALKRYGHVDDIAAMVAFVAGPEAGYITGASLTGRRGHQRLRKKCHGELPRKDRARDRRLTRYRSRQRARPCRCRCSGARAFRPRGGRGQGCCRRDPQSWWSRRGRKCRSCGAGWSA